MLNGQKILIVGGSSGIGRGVAEEAIKRGADVVIAGRSADKLKAAAEAMGPHASWRSLDFTREQDVARLFAEIGPLDHVVTTAGGVPLVEPVGDLDMDATRAFIDEKFVTSITLAKYASKALKPGGSIIFTSGINKDRPPVPGGSVVASVSGAFSYLARALALELAPIRVNVVSPGWVQTPMWDDIVGDAKTALWDDMAQRLPAGRIGTPADIALAYTFLMESTYTTGETIHIDGGHTLI